MSVQALLPESSVEGFHDRVVGGLAAAAEVHPDVIGVRPEIHLGSCELRIIVGRNSLWQAAVVFQSIHGGDYVIGAQGEADLDP
jgi:hypothetical protein